MTISGGSRDAPGDVGRKTSYRRDADPSRALAGYPAPGEPRKSSISKPHIVVGTSAEGSTDSTTAMNSRSASSGARRSRNASLPYASQQAATKDLYASRHTASATTELFMKTGAK